MYFMTSPATAMTMALSMMDEAAREPRRRRRHDRTPRSARRASTRVAEQPARRTWPLARVFRATS